MKLASETVKKRRVVSSNNNIINIKKQINNTRLLMKDKERGVSTTTRKTKCKEERAEALKPGTGSLL